MLTGLVVSTIVGFMVVFGGMYLMRLCVAVDSAALIV
jgi:hypothetical protein